MSTATATVTSITPDPPRLDELQAWLDTLHIKWRYDPALPLDKIDDKKSLANQARVDEPLVEDTVELYEAAYRDGTAFPPIIVREFPRAKKTVALDGNHRRTGAHRAGHTTHPALIVDCTDEAALTIMLEGNMTNGLQLPKPQRIAQAVHLVELGWTGSDAAKRLGVHGAEVSNARTVARAGVRAAGLDVAAFDRLPQGTRLQLARIGSDPVFAETAKLIVATGMTGQDTAELVRRVKAAKSDAAALTLIGSELEDRRDAIQKRHGVSAGRKPKRTEYGRAVDATYSVLAIDPDDVAASCPSPDAGKRLKERCRDAAEVLMAIAKAV